MDTSKKDIFPRLLDKAESDEHCPVFLSNVFIAETLPEALKMLPKINDSQSIVTKNGVWLSKNWAVVNNISDENESILYREDEIRRLNKEIDEISNTIKSLELDLSENEERLEDSESILSEHQSSITEQQDNISALREILASKSTRHATYKLSLIHI